METDEALFERVRTGDARARFSALSEAVARLPDPLAEVYHLRAAGLSYEEVASALDVPLGTIKSRMSRLVEVLRTEVGR